MAVTTTGTYTTSTSQCEIGVRDGSARIESTTETARARLNRLCFKTSKRARNTLTKPEDERTRMRSLGAQLSFSSVALAFLFAPPGVLKTRCANSLRSLLLLNRIWLALFRALETPGKRQWRTRVDSNRFFSSSFFSAFLRVFAT